MSSIADIIVAIFAEFARLVVIRNYAGIFWKKKESKLLIIACYAASYILTTVAYLLLHNMLINLAVTFAGILLISFAYDSKVIRRIIGSAIILAISVALDLFSAVILMDRPTSANYDLVSSFISVFLFFLSSIIAVGIFKNRKEDLPSTEWWYVLIITIGSTCVIFVLANDHVVSRTTVIWICIVLFVFNYIIYNLFTSIEEKHEYEREVLALKSQMNIFENQIAESIKRDEVVRMLRHDMKHHANELYHLADKSDNQAVKEYVIRMGEQIHLADPKVNCGVPAIDGVLGYMILQAESKGIEVHTHVVVPDSMQLSSYDMNILLGNLMQNSIDAARQCKDKHIDVLIRYERSCIFIKISNPYTGKLKLKDGEYQSTKKNDKDHGLGIKSAKNIVERYDGSIYFTEEEGNFVVKVVLMVGNENIASDQISPFRGQISPDHENTLSEML